jgi:hypothetical protein
MLDPNRVEEIFVDCLADGREDHVVAEGITCKVGLNPTRLENHRSEIEAMLDELPDEFKRSVGGGWSFLNACNDKHGNQWTGLHQRMEQLFQLGIGIGKVEAQLPRKMWAALPGGMPYYVINS